jgi:hypothetical protein
VRVLRRAFEFGVLGKPDDPDVYEYILTNHYEYCHAFVHSRFRPSERGLRLSGIWSLRIYLYRRDRAQKATAFIAKLATSTGSLAGSGVGISAGRNGPPAHSTTYAFMVAPMDLQSFPHCTICMSLSASFRSKSRCGCSTTESVRGSQHTPDPKSSPFHHRERNRLCSR